jgi:hypothetical protein
MFAAIGLGLTALAVSGFVADISNKIDEIVKPVYDFFEEREKQALLVSQEELNWKSTMKIKTTKIKNDEIRNRYKIIRPNITSIKNNSQDICELIYIDKLRITSEQLYTDISKLSRKDIYYCQSIKIGVDNTLELINEEFKIYNILLYTDNKFRILKNDEVTILVVPVAELQYKYTGIDLGCRF